MSKTQNESRYITIPNFLYELHEEMKTMAVANKVHISKLYEEAVTAYLKSKKKGK